VGRTVWAFSARSHRVWRTLQPGSARDQCAPRAVKALRSGIRNICRGWLRPKSSITQMIQGDRYAHFPNAQVLISGREWRAAQGLAGRLAGYLIYRGPRTSVIASAAEPVSYQALSPENGRRSRPAAVT
jgi:hypothetical protein